MKFAIKEFFSYFRLTKSQWTDRFYYNGVPSEDSYGLDGPSDENYPMPNEEK